MNMRLADTREVWLVTMNNTRDGRVEAAIGRVPTRIPMGQLRKRGDIWWIRYYRIVRHDGSACAVARRQIDDALERTEAGSTVVRGRG